MSAAESQDRGAQEKPADGGEGFVGAASALLEARSEPRVAADCAAELYSADFDGPLPARVRDVGIAGACVATEGRVARRSIRRIVLRLPAGRVVAEARGTWQNVSSGDEAVLTGLAFKGLSQTEGELLGDFVAAAVERLGRFVRECPDFADLAPDDARGLTQASRFRVVPSGACVYREDTEAPEDASIFLLKEGTVALVRRVDDSRDVTLMRLGPGSLIGGIPVVAGVPNTESAIVSGGNARLMEITSGSFAYLRVAMPLLAYRVARSVARSHTERMRELLRRLVQ